MKYGLIFFLTLFFNKNISAKHFVLSLSDKKEIPFGEIKPSSFDLQHGDTMSIVFNKNILGDEMHLAVCEIDSNLKMHVFPYIIKNENKETVQIVFNSKSMFFIKSKAIEEVSYVPIVIMSVIFLALIFIEEFIPCW